MTTEPLTFGAFLRSRRDRVTPSQAGIAAFPGARRVPGLRKEELAALVGVSADHYSRLEQGRQLAVSDDLVAALARALQLDDAESAHLRNLAQVDTNALEDVGVVADPGMLRLLETLSHVPALLLGPRSVVLGSNALLRETLGWSAAPGDLFCQWLFLDPNARVRIENWETFASAAVGALRYESGQSPRDDALLSLIDYLRRSEPLVDRWWGENNVALPSSVIKWVNHPIAGSLEFTVESVANNSDSRQQLVVYTVEPGSLTARRMMALNR